MEPTSTDTSGCNCPVALTADDPAAIHRCGAVGFGVALVAGEKPETQDQRDNDRADPGRVGRQLERLPGFGIDSHGHDARTDDMNADKPANRRAASSQVAVGGPAGHAANLTRERVRPMSKCFRTRKFRFADEAKSGQTHQSFFGWASARFDDG